VTARTAADDPYGPIIADFRAAMNQIKCASSERLRRMGISMAQLHILYTLQRSGEMPMSKLADVLQVSLSNATGLIDRIEERGFVERTRVPEDRRVVVIRVTDAGRRMLDEVDAVSTELLRSVFDRIGRNQLSGVGRAIAELRRALEDTTGIPSERHPASTPAPLPLLIAPSGRLQRRTDLWPTKPTPSRPWRRTPPSG